MTAWRLPLFYEASQENTVDIRLTNLCVLNRQTCQSTHELRISFNTYPVTLVHWRQYGSPADIMLADPCIVFPYLIYISTIQVQYKEFFVVQDWYWSVYYKAVNDQLHTIEFLPIQCKVSTITGTVKKKLWARSKKSINLSFISSTVFWQHSYLTWLLTLVNINAVATWNLTVTSVKPTP
jgi:hypothetical protein